MRLRLRVPKDDAEKSQGFRGWLRRLFGIDDAPALPPAPEPECEPEPSFDTRLIDRRWTKLGEGLAYVQTGRLCRRPEGAWRTEYLFDVFADGKLWPVRIVIDEPAVTEWEKTKESRMPEAGRFQLVKETLESVLQAGERPEEHVVEAGKIGALTI